LIYKVYNYMFPCDSSRAHAKNRREAEQSIFPQARRQGGQDDEQARKARGQACRETGSQEGG
jgi:hypothetical protein